MPYSIGANAPASGIYRCRNCGEAKGYDEGEPFQQCNCLPENNSEHGWVLVDEE